MLFSYYSDVCLRNDVLHCAMWSSWSHFFRQSCLSRFLCCLFLILFSWHGVLIMCTITDLQLAVTLLGTTSHTVPSPGRTLLRVLVAFLLAWTRLAVVLPSPSRTRRFFACRTATAWMFFFLLSVICCKLWNHNGCRLVVIKHTTFKVRANV